MKGGLLQRFRQRTGGSYVLPWQTTDSLARPEDDGTAGFTIVEIMIVIAVTGALFLSAVLLINGRQNRTEFTQAIQEVQSEIQQHITEVANGYYANKNDFNCTSDGSTLQITSGSNKSGTNAGCIFLGKVLQFGINSTATSQPYNVYSLAGMQQDANGNAFTTLAATTPTVIGAATENESLQYGLTAVNMFYGTNPAANKIGAVAFVSDLGSLDNNGQLASGSQQINMIPVPTTALNDSAGTDITAINTKLGTATVINPTGGVSICFKSATTNQSGLVTIGGDNQVLSVTLIVKGNTTCS